MLRLDRDKLIALEDLPNILPPARNGQPIRRATIDRWYRKGLKDRILKTVLISGKRYTTDFELNRSFLVTGESRTC